MRQCNKFTLELRGYATNQQIYSSALGLCDKDATSLLSSSGAICQRNKLTLELWGHATTRQIYSLALRPCNYATNLLQSSGAMQQSNKFTLELWGNAITMQQVYSKAVGPYVNATNLLYCRALRPCNKLTLQ